VASINPSAQGHAFAVKTFLEAGVVAAAQVTQEVAIVCIVQVAQEAWHAVQAATLVGEVSPNPFEQGHIALAKTPDLLPAAAEHVRHVEVTETSVQVAQPHTTAASQTAALA